jgi:hypothetical protein
MEAYTMSAVTFEQLLESTANGDIEKLVAKKAALQSEKAKLQEKLTAVNRGLYDIEAQITAPIRNAVKAAQLLGVAVPEKYMTVKVNGVNDGKRSLGKFYWEVAGMMPFQSEVSRAMWRFSAGSGGSAGKNGEAVLTAEEFWALVKLDESKVKLGEKNTVTLPNGRIVTFQKTEE